MDQYFKKLDLSIDVFDIKNLELIRPPSITNSYSNIGNKEVRDYLLNVFPQVKAYNVVLSEFTDSVPHFDGKNITCAINHYYITLDAETIFYDPIHPDVKPWAEHSNGVYNPIYKEDLIEKVRFKAEPNSVWMLNVSRPHNLLFTIPGVRVFIKWQFLEPYDYVFNKIVNNQ
jgi:hypothetical protein